MKTAEELNVLKNEVEAINAKLAELSEDEIALVTGGADDPATEPSRTVPGWQDQVRMFGAAGGIGGGSGAGIGSGGGGGGGSGAAMSSEDDPYISGHSGSNGGCGIV